MRLTGLIFRGNVRRSLHALRETKRVAVLVICVVLVGSSARAATYFIAPAGNDANTCTVAKNASTPKKTFASAVACLTPGDELVLRDGTYTKAVHGRLIANCNSGMAKSGLDESRRITVRAENERRAHLLDDGNSWGIVNIVGCDYWTIQGLRISSVQNSAATVASNTGIKVQGAAHVVIRRNLVHDLNHSIGSSAINYAYDASDGLIEENEAYNLNRDIIYALKVPRMTFRRNYCYGGKPPGVRGPHECFLAYQTTDAIFENNIAEYSAALGTGGAEGFGDTGARNRFLGNIAVGCRNGFGVTKHPNRYMAQRDSILENNVAIGAGSEPMSNGLAAHSMLNLQVRNMSIFGGSVNGVSANNQYDPRNGATTQTQQNPEITLTNTLVQDTPYGFGINDVSQFNVVSLSYSVGWNNSSSTWFRGTDSRQMTTTPPPGVAKSSDLGSCRVFIPASSSLKRRGKNGADIGANVLYRYENGALTTKPLWNPTTGAFPCGAIVQGVNDKPGKSCFDVHLRLNVNANGCKLPSGYGGALKLPDAPTEFAVQ